MAVASQLGQELTDVFPAPPLNNCSPLCLTALRVTGGIQITARIGGPWRVAPQN